MEKEKGLNFKVGQLIEMKTFEKGFRGAWFRSKVIDIDLKENNIKLEYYDFDEEEISWTNIYDVPPYVRKSSLKKKQLMLRPQYPLQYHKSELPPVNSISEICVVIDGAWKVGDMVDWDQDDCFWSATVIKVLSNDKVQLELPMPPAGEGSDDILVAFCKDLRPSLEWSQRKGWALPTMDGQTASGAQLIFPSKQASERRPEAVTCGMNAENLTFVKRTPLWHTIESMEAFQKIPQNPHFRPLLGVKESAREGMAIGTMVTFSTVVGRTYCLRVDGPRSAIEDCLETLVELESNGFDVEVIRDRLTRLLLLKDKQEELADRSKGVVEKIEKQKIQEKTVDDEVDEIDRQIRQLEDTWRKVLQKKEKWTLENDAMKAAEEAIEQELREVAAKFDGLAAAPL